MHEFARKTRDKILRRVEFICNLIFIDDWGKSYKTGSNQEGLICLDMTMTGLYP